MITRAVVIGAGFGGLALAIRLQSAGVATTVVEARERPGGHAYVWHRSGHVFDAGPTVITDNIIDGTLKGAIIGQRWSDPVTGDLASLGNAGYAHLTVERNRAS